MAYTYDDSGNLVEHKGEIASEPFDIGKVLLDYGWVPPAAGAAVAGAKKAKEWWDQSKESGGIASRLMSRKDKNVVDVEAREVVPETTPESVVNLQEEAAKRRAAGIGAKQQPAPQPAAQPPVTPTTTYNQPLAQVPGMPPQVAPAQAPVAPVQPPAAPVEAPVAQAPATPVAEPTVGVAPAETNIAGRVRRTKDQIAKDLEARIASAPEGMLPSAPNPKKSNKLLPSDVIGQGGWHWYQGQMGPEAERAWLEQFGRTNQSYQDVKQAVREGRLPVPDPTQSHKGGAHPRQEFVPGYIKGAVSPAQLLNLAGNALGGIGLAEAYKEGKKTGDYSDFGLGAIGQILGNIAPRASVGFSLMAPSETNKGEKEELAKRRKKQPTID